MDFLKKRAKQILVQCESRLGTGGRLRPPSHPGGSEDNLVLRGGGSLRLCCYCCHFFSALCSNELGTGSQP